MVNGKLSAVNEESATELLGYAGYQVISLKPQRQLFNSDKLLAQLFPVKPTEITLFYRQLALLLESGIAITTSLELLEGQADNRTLKRIMGEVIADLRQGNQLSAALGKHPEAFPPIHCQTLAVGEQGAMWHHQNKTWTALSSRFTSAGFSAIWGSSASDIFMVGAGGAVAHHDGKAWAAMTSGTTLDLNAVWGASKAAVYAVGGDGKKPVALRYDGSSWSSFPMPSDKYGYTLHGVWGKNATDVFAVGSQDHPYAGGIMLHLTGKAWQVHTAWKAGSIFTSRYDLWGHGAALYAVGYYSPCIATLANAKWSGGKCENYSVLRGIWGAGPSAIFAVGGSEPALAQRIKHWGGVAWAHHDAKGHALLDVWGNDQYNSPSLALAAGNADGIGLVWDLEGDDSYNANANNTLGFANSADYGEIPGFTALKCIGLLLDLAGVDSYERPDMDSVDIGNDKVWVNPPAHENLGHIEKGGGIDAAQ